MRIHYMSDIHLEFGALDKPLPDGEILILGGDITLLSAFDQEAAYHDPRAAVLRERTEAFLTQCRTHFERIFYLIGNHEPYGYDLTKTPKMIRSKLKGVELLENKAVDLGSNVVLAGATLWTDMNKGRDAWQVSRGMNDFQGAIHVEDLEGTRAHDERRFTTDDAIERFNKSLRFIARTADANSDKLIVVATHHAPSIRGLNPEHTRGAGSHINAGYYTDLHDFIAGHPNIRWWCFGHTHIQMQFMVGQCTCLSNARGYIGREPSADAFDPDCWFNPVSGARSKRPPTEEEIRVARTADIEDWRRDNERAPLDSSF